jgi:hypothetical protein
MTDPRFYRAQADQARAEADAAALDNVRDRLLRSAVAFEAMAERYERVATSRAAREAAVGTYHTKEVSFEHPDDSHRPSAAPAAAAAAG